MSSIDSVAMQREEPIRIRSAGGMGAMHIVFGWGLDGHSYPPTATGCAAAIGQPVVGPTGLLNLLEVSLGLAGPTMPAAVRIARYQGRLRVLDDGQQFYSQSFARDAWATAKQILAWRDELCGGGVDRGAHRRRRAKARNFGRA